MDNASRVREEARRQDVPDSVGRVVNPAGVSEMKRAAGAEDLVRNVETEAPTMAEREQVRRMGWQVIDGGRRGDDEIAQQAERRAELLTAAGELARDELEVARPERFVGDETKIQIEEHKQDDLEDAKNEAGEGLSFENRIVAKNQEGVARVIAPEVDRMMGQKRFRVSDLERLYREGVNKMLEVFNRRIGDRN